MKEEAASSRGFFEHFHVLHSVGKTLAAQWTMPSRSSQPRESETQKHTLLRAAMIGPVLCSWQDKSKKGMPSDAGDRGWLARLPQKSK